MKSKNITTIIVEGTDGVGKSELIKGLFEHYNYRYMCYHRGELSNIVYALKYGRPVSITQNGLPFLHILLFCQNAELSQRIFKREKELHLSKKEVNEDLDKMNDQKEFCRWFNILKNDYHMIFIDTTKMSINEVKQEAVKRIDNYIKNLSCDKTLSDWNKNYKKACEKLNIPFCVRDNQPYINNIQTNAEITLHNGVYEMFSNKAYPDNFIYSLSYDNFEQRKKKYDFAYIINSKIKRRTEIFNYYDVFDKNDKTCLVSDYELIPKYDNLIVCEKTFGNDFISMLSEARATVYCARDLAPFKWQTGRLYEAILAHQIVFVDKESDINNEILTQIHHDKFLENLLYINEKSIIDNYNYIMSNQDIYNEIITNQNKFYARLKEELNEAI